MIAESVGLKHDLGHGFVNPRRIGSAAILSELVLRLNASCVILVVMMKEYRRVSIFRNSAMNGLRIPLRFRARVKSKVPRTFAFSQMPHQDKDVLFQEAHQLLKLSDLMSFLELRDV